MKPFSSIESLRHLIQNVRRHCSKYGKPLPVVEFEGTVKLHGTNAGVRFTPGKVQPQGRNRILDITSDNFGFAFFVKNSEFYFETLANVYRHHYKLGDDYDITLFGEWCGSGIQKAVGVAQVPKHFVLFSVWDNKNEVYLPRLTVSAEDMQHSNEVGIYCINQIPTYTVAIDFGDAEAAACRIVDLTLEVERECPWAKFRGAAGIGEGIVWVKADEPGDSNWWFKSKGEEHQKAAHADSKGKTNVQIDTKKINEINALVEEIVPEGRLIQGISYLKENNIPVHVASTGQYIGWVAKDTAKEEYDTIAASGMEWKTVQGAVVAKARLWFFAYLDKGEE